MIITGRLCRIIMWPRKGHNLLPAQTLMCPECNSVGVGFLGIRAPDPTGLPYTGALHWGFTLHYLRKVRAYFQPTLQMISVGHSQVMFEFAAISV
jgi:hypothetical protein